MSAVNNGIQIWSTSSSKWVNAQPPIDSNSIQTMANKIIDGLCNTLTNISLESSFIGVLPVPNGGTGYSDLPINGILLGNRTSTPTIQTIDGAILDTQSVQSMANKIIDGACNSITNVPFSALSGIIPVIKGGTELSSIALNGVIIGNDTSVPTVQTLLGVIIDSSSVQSVQNKIIDGLCNTLTNVSLQSSVVGVLPVPNGGTGLDSIPLNGLLIGNDSSVPTVQTLLGAALDAYSVQSMANKIIDGACNTLTNIPFSSLSGLVPVVKGGTGLSSIALNGVLVGNDSSTPTVQTLLGAIIDSYSVQSVANKIIDGACNTITNVPFSGVVGINYTNEKMTQSFAVVANSNVTANSLIFLGYNVVTDYSTQGSLYVHGISPGVEFQIASNKAFDSNDINYFVIY